MIRAAIISEDTLYRYWLTRIWDPGLPRVVFIGLNPSVADANIDDPTQRRLIRFAQDWGYGSQTTVNLFALRSPYPRDLKWAIDPIWPENDTYLQDIIQNAKTVVCMWGTHGKFLARDEAILAMIAQPMCFRVNTDGSPAHPLYLKNTTTLIPYR